MSRKTILPREIGTGGAEKRAHTAVEAHLGSGYRKKTPGRLGRPGGNAVLETKWQHETGVAYG